jgi:hypothetical protein
MKIAYIAGPYRDERGEWFVHQNIQRASEVALKYWRLGYAVICPHRNAAFFGGACPDDTWLKGDMEFVRVCDVLVLMGGWNKSEGAREEFFRAVCLGKEIIRDGVGIVVQARERRC